MIIKAPASLARHWPTARAVLVMAGLLTVLISLVRWGGTARPGPLFVTGVALLTSLLLIFGLIVAWIFTAPAPAIDELTPMQIELRQIVALLALMSAGAFVIGGTWDELWHRRFGGFGRDFLWPPHLMIYGSIAFFMLVASGGVWIALRGAGRLRTRLRAEGQLTLLSLVCMYLIASLPSDELWHRIYGKDITAWSLPHLIVGSGFCLIALVSAALALSSLPRYAAWRDVRQLRPQEIVAILLTATAAIILLLLGTVEWEGIKSLRSNGDVFSNAFWLRPQWLYPVVIITVSLFFSTFILHILRCVGSATIVALLVFIFRYLCVRGLTLDGFQSDIDYVSQFLPIIPALALDGWYFFQKRSADQLSMQVVGNLLMIATFLVVALPTIRARLIYPPINGFTVPRMIGMSIIMGLAAGWLGARFWWMVRANRPHRARSTVASPFDHDCLCRW